MSVLKRRIGTWLIISALGALLLFAAYLLGLHNPLLFQAFLGLYAVDSVFFFLVSATSPTIGKTMLIFLISLELTIGAYYLFSYLSLSV